MDHRIHQLPKTQSLQIPSVQKKNNQDIGTKFKDVLLDQQRLKISKHANIRLQERNIQINEKQWEKITNKVIEAKHKGITDSLVITNNAALLVSNKNNVVVTAMDRSEATSKIITNINGAILIDE